MMTLCNHYQPSLGAVTRVATIPFATGVAGGDLCPAGLSIRGVRLTT